MDFCETYSNRELFCSGWEFYKAPLGTEYSADMPFAHTDIPHDWLIYDTNALYEDSTGWYRKRFTYAKKEGVRTYIRFDGVYMDSTVYVNGEKRASGNTATRLFSSILPSWCAAAKMR